jgi:putative GTP pyrophosphokinase
MSEGITKSRIDRLGDRLRKGNITESDLRLLDQYRLSFTEAHEFVVGAIREDLGLEPTGRPAKSTTAISEKLRRESIRLTQMQDITGCRLTVFEIVEQERIVESVTKLFDKSIVGDRRERPSHGYRAVHVIVSFGGKLVEVQVRTLLQHLWAELSEKLSDIYDPAIKYGGGPKNIRSVLTATSSMVASVEEMEVWQMNVQTTLPLFTRKDHQSIAIAKHRAKMIELRQRAFKLLRKVIDDLESSGAEHDFLD